MYKLVRILTQSPSEYLFYPGRIVEVRIGLNGVENGIIYNSCGCQIFTPKKPDFEFELLYK